MHFVPKLPLSQGSRGINGYEKIVEAKTGRSTDADSRARVVHKTFVFNNSFAIGRCG
jgi:hypothetical protein